MGLRPSASAISHARKLEELTRCASRLTRSFTLSAVLLVLNLLAPVALGLPYTGSRVLIAAGLALAMLASYVWYATAAGAAARTLDEDGRQYVAWILAAPLVAYVMTLIEILPGIGVDIIAASPLSVKFLLGNQLDEELRRATSMNLSGVD